MNIWAPPADALCFVTSSKLCCSLSVCNPALPLLLQVFWALQLVTVLVPGAVFHLYAACKNIDQEEILERPIYTVFYIISVLLRIILEVIAFWLQSHLFGFQVGRASQEAAALRNLHCLHPSAAKPWANLAEP